MIYPVTTLFAAARAVADVLDRARRARRAAFDAFTDMIGLPEMRALEDRLTDPGAASS